MANHLPVPFGAVERPRICRVCGMTKAAHQFRLKGRWREGKCRTCRNAWVRSNRDKDALCTAYKRRYATDARFREQEKAKARRRYQQTAAALRLDGARSNYVKRYNSDPEFRARKLAYLREWHRRRRACESP